MRLAGLPLEPWRVVLVFAYTNAALIVFHLLPIPGLDGARIVASLLPPQAAEVYRNADQVPPAVRARDPLPVLDLVGGVLETMAGAICEATTSVDCVPAMQVRLG